ncbi:MAG: PqqD family protein [Clostridia bacterium]|nr:PqqD family protein [Clostridia bacterium]
MTERTYRIKVKYIMREIAGEYLAIPLGAEGENTSQIVILNPVSKLLWEALQSEVTLGELVDKVLSSFDVSREEAEADTKDFLFELIQLGFLN